MQKETVMQGDVLKVVGSTITLLKLNLSMGKAGRVLTFPCAGVEVNCSSLFLNVSLSFRIIFNIVMPLHVQHLNY